MTTEEIVARVAREVDALGLTDQKARANVAHALAMKYLWLAVRDERAARSVASEPVITPC